MESGLVCKLHSLINHAKIGTNMHFMSPTLQIGHQHHILKYDYVGDRLACHQDAEKCHQRPYFVTSMTMSPTSLSSRKNDFDHKNGNFLI